MRDGGVDLKNGLFSEDDAALPHGSDIPSESQLAEIVEEPPVEQPQPVEDAQVLVVEMERFQVVQHRFEAGGHEIAPLCRKGAHEEAEGGGPFGHALGHVRSDHGELVEIGQERG